MLLCGADIIVRTLIEQGCNTIFGYPGGQVLDIYHSLHKYQDEIKHVLTADEQGAAHAADGFARSSGRTGVVLATSGPGATNLVTGIATAYLDSIPMVAITGNVPTSMIGTDSFQELDITGVTLPITKHNYFVGSIESLADTIREAFRLAASGRPGPVLVDIPKDIQRQFCEYTPAPAVTADEPFAAKDIRIQEAAKCINQAKRPFIFFGGGLVSSGAQAEMLELADRIDAALGCSFMGISAIPTDYPRFLGMQGMHGRYACSVAMGKADCVIALGTRFSDRATGGLDTFIPDAKIVHIDIEGAELSKTTRDTHALRGDIKKTLEALLPLISKAEHPQWKKQVADIRTQEDSYRDTREGLTPLNIMETINRCREADMPVATDVGQHQMWSAQMLNFSRERTFISSGGLGAMGYGMGGAIGSAMATGKKTLLITGDGSFGMDLNELATVVTHQLPITVILLNNRVLGMVRQLQDFFFDKTYSNTSLENRHTDFVMLAKAFGADAERVCDVDSFEKALKKAIDGAKPYVIEVMVDKDEYVLPMIPGGKSVNEIITKVGD